MAQLIPPSQHCCLFVFAYIFLFRFVAYDTTPFRFPTFLLGVSSTRDPRFRSALPLQFHFTLSNFVFVFSPSGCNAIGTTLASLRDSLLVLFASVIVPIYIDRSCVQLQPYSSRYTYINILYNMHIISFCHWSFWFAFRCFFLHCQHLVT